MWTTNNLICKVFKSRDRVGKKLSRKSRCLRLIAAAEWCSPVFQGFLGSVFYGIPCMVMSTALKRACDWDMWSCEFCLIINHFTKRAVAATDEDQRSLATVCCFCQ